MLLVNVGQKVLADLREINHQHLESRLGKPSNDIVVGRHYVASARAFKQAANLAKVVVLHKNLFLCGIAVFDHQIFKIYDALARDDEVYSVCLFSSFHHVLFWLREQSS